MGKGDDIRYGRIGDIIQIVIRMRGTRRGLTLADIAEELNATRRTAERVRDAVMANFTQIGELEPEGKYKRWGFVQWLGKGLTQNLISFTEGEIRDLELLRKEAEQKGQAERAKLLKSLGGKLAAFIEESKTPAAADPDRLKALMEFEGSAVSRFFAYKADGEFLALIRDALAHSLRLSFGYTSRDSEPSQREVEPYGILYHYKSYLVARDDGMFKLFSLTRIQNPQLSESAFVPDPGFSLREFSDRSRVARTFMR